MHRKVVRRGKSLRMVDSVGQQQRANESILGSGQIYAQQFGMHVNVMIVSYPFQNCWLAKGVHNVGDEQAKVCQPDILGRIY